MWQHILRQFSHCLAGAETQFLAIRADKRETKQSCADQQMKTHQQSFLSLALWTVGSKRARAPSQRRVIVPAGTSDLEAASTKALPTDTSISASQRYYHAMATALNSLPVRVEMPVLDIELWRLWNSADPQQQRPPMSASLIGRVGSSVSGPLPLVWTSLAGSCFSPEFASVDAGTWMTLPPRTLFTVNKTKMWNISPKKTDHISRNCHMQRSKLQRYSITSSAVASNVVGTVAKRRRKRVLNLVSRHPFRVITLAIRGRLISSSNGRPSLKEFRNASSRPSEQYLRWF
jgi:hypothetical protein